jgi:NTP pyrophosphatase (non-canonical NTP hydrolase)
VNGINQAAHEIQKNAIEHGWWKQKREFPAILTLIHFELAEALEEYGNGHAATETYYKKGGKPEGIPSELADVIICIFDCCGYSGIDIKKAIKEKHEFNKCARTDME